MYQKSKSKMNICPKKTIQGIHWSGTKNKTVSFPAVESTKLIGPTNKQGSHLVLENHHTLTVTSYFGAVYVLLEKYAPLESNHGLTDAKVTARLEVSFELRQDEIKKGAHLEQRVVERRVMSRCVCCVLQVEILVQFKKTCLLHDITDPRICEARI